MSAPRFTLSAYIFEKVTSSSRGDIQLSKTKVAPPIPFACFDELATCDTCSCRSHAHLACLQLEGCKATELDCSCKLTSQEMKCEKSNLVSRVSSENSALFTRTCFLAAEKE